MFPSHANMASLGHHNVDPVQVKAVSKSSQSGVNCPAFLRVGSVQQHTYILPTYHCCLLLSHFFRSCQVGLEALPFLRFTQPILKKQWLAEVATTTTIPIALLMVVENRPTAAPAASSSLAISAIEIFGSSAGGGGNSFTIRFSFSRTASKKRMGYWQGGSGSGLRIQQESVGCKAAPLYHLK